MLVPVILCGGSGSRLWPVSRETHPKPFLVLADGQSLVQKAFLRAAGQAEVVEVVTVTNRELLFKAEDAYAVVNSQNLPTTFLLEPFARNTAPAIAAAVLHVLDTHGPDTVLLILAADHLVAEHDTFVEEVARAVDFAQQGRIATFGIRPDAPETGYGYIEANGSDVVRFIEKPDAAAAQSYLDQGSFYWNSGMFCFRADVMRDALAEHCPDVLAAVRASLDSARRAHGDGVRQIELAAAHFQNATSISIDHAVMEKAANLSLVPCDIGWSDIGSWDAISLLAAPDARGNRTQGDVMLQDADNCFIQGDSRVIAALGVSGLIVIDTPDALLIADRDRAQQVKTVFERLKSMGHETHRTHATVHRPWGSYTVLDEGECFKAKRIVVKPGGRLSLQMHHRRSEHWTVVSGAALITNGAQRKVYTANQSLFIPVGNQHRLENEGHDDVILIEVQCGDYFGEDDIVRLEDAYGRAP